MYKVKTDGLTKDALKRGDTRLLLALLEKSNENIVRELKIPGSNTAYLQGASHVVDELIKIYKSA